MAQRLKMLSLLTLLVTVGICHGDGENKASSTNLGDDNLSFKIVNMALDCYDDSTNFALEHEKPVQDSEKLTAIKNVQSSLSRICEMCLNDVTLYSETNQREIPHNTFLILRQFMEASLTTGPHEDLRVLAALLYGNHTVPEETLNASPPLRCVENLGEKINKLTAIPGLELAGQMLVLYYETRSLKNCLKEQHHPLTSASKFWTSLDKHLDSLTGNMTCVSPEGDDRDLCRNVAKVYGLANASFCPVKRETGEPPMIDTLGRHLLSCFLGTEPEGAEKARDVNWYRNFYREQCRDKVMLKRCIHSTSVMSWVCLGQGDWGRIQWAAESLLKAVEVGCLNHGEPLAVLSAHYNEVMKNTSCSSDQYEACIFPLQEENDSSNDILNYFIGINNENARKLDFYKKYFKVKDCLMKKHSDDKMVTFYKQILADELSKGMMCFQRNTNKYIPCSILAMLPRQQHYYYSGQEVDWKNVYSEFTRMGFACVNLHRNISHFDSMSKLEDFQVYFAAHCRREGVIKQCLSDMSAYSQVSLRDYLNLRYQTFLNMMDVVMKTVCLQEGKKLASIAFAMNKQKEALEPCWAKAHSTLLNKSPVKTSSTESTYSKSLMTLKDFTQCFRNNYKNQDNNKTVILDDLEYIEMTARCAHKGFHMDFCEYNTELRKNCTTRYCFITTGSIIF